MGQETLEFYPGAENVFIHHVTCTLKSSYIRRNQNPNHNLLLNLPNLFKVKVEVFIFTKWGEIDAMKDQDYRTNHVWDDPLA